MTEHIEKINEYLGEYKWVIAVGIIGGLLNVGSNPNKSTGRKWLDNLIGVISSGFFGWMGYEVIKFIWQSQQVALAGCGFFAWKGATWIGITLDKIIDKFVDSKLRRSDDGSDFDNQEDKEYK